MKKTSKTLNKVLDKISRVWYTIGSSRFLNFKKGDKMYDYSVLNGKIIEKFGSKRKFAAALGTSEHSISMKLNGKQPWKQSEIGKACNLLSINPKDIHKYFFALKVQNY